MIVKELITKSRAFCKSSVQKLKAFLGRLSERQKYCILVVLYLLFALADIWVFVRVCYGNHTPIEHIQSVRILEYDRDTTGE